MVGYSHPGLLLLLPLLLREHSHDWKRGRKTNRKEKSIKGGGGGGGRGSLFLFFLDRRGMDDTTRQERDAASCAHPMFLVGDIDLGARGGEKRRDMNSYY